MQFTEGNDGGVSSNQFLKLKDKDKVSGVFRGEIHHFKQHWENQKSSVCPGKDTCEKCKAGNKAAFRFRLNFILKDAATNELTSKIFEQSWGTYLDLKTLHESGYELDKHFVSISRAGTGQATRYTVIPLPKGQLTELQEKNASVVKLQDLVNLDEASGPKGDNPPPFDDDIPF